MLGVCVSAGTLAILDWMMPGLTGLEVCDRIRKRAREPYTYILLLTSKSQKEDLIEGMDAGADDYITKPFDQHELQVRLRAGRRLVDLQAELLSAREALREQATKDSLTHLWNRSAIYDLLCRELSRAQREGTTVGVVMVDLDHFKSVNDNHGHFAGDAVLCESARRMRLAEALPVPSEGHNHTRRLPARAKGDMRDETTSDPRRHGDCRRVIDGRRMGSGIRAGERNRDRRR